MAGGGQGVWVILIVHARLLPSQHKKGASECIDTSHPKCGQWWDEDKRQPETFQRTLYRTVLGSVKVPSAPTEPCSPSMVHTRYLSPSTTSAAQWSMQIPRSEGCRSIISSKSLYRGLPLDCVLSWCGHLHRALRCVGGYGVCDRAALGIGIALRHCMTHTQWLVHNE